MPTCIQRECSLKQVFLSGPIVLRIVTMLIKLLKQLVDTTPAKLLHHARLALLGKTVSLLQIPNHMSTSAFYCEGY